MVLGSRMSVVHLLYVENHSASWLARSGLVVRIVKVDSYEAASSIVIQTIVHCYCYNNICNTGSRFIYCSRVVTIKCGEIS